MAGSFLDLFRRAPAPTVPARIKTRSMGRARLSYDAAAQPFWDNGSGRMASGPNSDVLWSFSALRNRARHQYQNNPHARSAVNVRVRGVIGTGLIPRFGDDRLDALFAEWARVCYVGSDLDFYGLQDLIERTRVLSGEVLVRGRLRQTSDGYPVPLQLEVLECDQLDDNKTGETGTDGGPIVAGVQFDAIGRRTGYWILPNHPSDAIYTATAGLGTSRFAPYASVAHYFRADRPGQVRGVTDLAAILEALQYLADLQLAKMLKLRAESSIVAAVTSDDEDSIPLTGTAEDEDSVPDAGLTTAVETVGVSSVMRLFPGEEVTFAQQTASPDFVDLVREQERRLAVGVEMTFEKLTGNLSTVNYSSYKAGLQDFDESCRAHRENELQPMVLDRIVQWWVDAAKLAGKIPATANVTWKWSSPRKGIDKEQADIDQMRLLAKIASPQEVIASTGRDPMTVLDEIAVWNAACKARGIDPTIVLPASIANPAATAPRV